MESLRTLDAEFLHIEDGTTPMHIAGISVFEGPRPEYDDLRALLEGKLDRIPRYRQRVRDVPLGLGRPVWCDAPDFRPDDHLRHTALPAPGGEAELERLVGRLMSQPLDRDRPLWETWLVEGLAGGRWALVCKVHHCMVDGVAGMALLEAFLDVAPDAAVPDPTPWAPAPEPSGAAKVLGAWRGLAGDVASRARRAPELVADPGRALRGVGRTALGLVQYGRLLDPGPPLQVEGGVSPRRRWTGTSASLDDVKAVRRALGGTVNDVVLTVVAGGFRRYLGHLGDDPDEAGLRTLVPVSVRREDGTGVPDNRVSAMLVDLPVHIESPLARLEELRRQVGGLKRSHMAEAGEWVTDVGDLAPPGLLGVGSRATVRVLHRVHQRSVGTVTTNVPGPQVPLYCLGRRMLEHRPYVPIFEGMRVATAIVSYDGRLFFGFTGDRDTAHDLAVLATGTTDDLAALRALVPGEAPRRRAARARAGRATG